MRVVRAWLLGDGVKEEVDVERVRGLLKKGCDVVVELDDGRQAVISNGSVFVLPINIKDAEDVRKVEEYVKKLMYEAV